MVTRNTSVSLGESLTEFAHQQVEKGSYGSTSEVVRAGLRLLAEREASLEALRQALIEGDESGPGEPFDFEAFLARKRQEYAGTDL
jgi:antitoxin ParD1/3/4